MENEIRMSITIESSSSTNKMPRTNIAIPVDDITNIVEGNNTTLVIILAVTLPALAFIAILTTIVVCYRRRNTTIWLKKLENSSRLQAIIVNRSPSSIQPQYSEKKPYRSNGQFPQPYTKTVIYNQLSIPSLPIVYSSFKSSIKGETNAAFDGYLIKNEQQPILKSSSNYGRNTTTLQTDFPLSLQAPVRTITPTFVEAIATHHLSLLTDTSNLSLETLTSKKTSNNSRDSDTSSSSQRILLFSQRTEF